MVFVLVFFALFFSLFNHSSGQYCLCKPGSQAPDPYQKVINYACGNGADCGPIQPNGPCYQANEIQGLCSYAANSYYQNEKSLGATCDFGGVAAPSPSLPTDLPSGCTYPTSAGTASPTSNGTGIPTSPAGVISPPGGISPPGSMSPPAGIDSPTGGMNSPPGGINTVPGTSPGIFSPMALGPSGSTSDPSFNRATSLLQTPSYIVPPSLIALLGLFFQLG